MPKLTLTVRQQVYLIQLRLVADHLGLTATHGPSASAVVDMLGRAAFVLGAGQVAGYLRPLQNALAASDAEHERLQAEAAHHAQTGE